MINRDKSMHRKQMFFSIFVVALLVFSTFAFVLSFKAPAQDYSYNGFEFSSRNNQWITEANSKEYAFYFHPQDLWMALPQEVITKIRQSPSITIAFDPTMDEIQNLEIARFELAQFLMQDLGKNVQSAVTNQSSAYSFPVETCTQNSNSLFITFSKNNQSSASVNGNCIDISSVNTADHVRYAEKIIYTLLGVM
jgi:hypothetical protein